MDLLNIYFKIFIISLLNLGNTISATDLGVYNRLGKNIFYFNEKDTEYSFMVLDFKVNGTEYILSKNKILREFILKNIPENEIKTIKKEIIEASELDEDKELKDEHYTKLIDIVEVVKLKKTGAQNSSYEYVIKGKKGSYYRSYYEFLHDMNGIHVGSFESKDSEEDSEEDSKYKDWEEDSNYTEIIYVISDLIINNEDIEKQLKLCNSINEDDCQIINRNLFSWCQDCNFRSFGTLHTDMDFKKLILSCYKKENKYQNVYAAYELGYLNKTLEKFEAEFKQDLQSFIDNNTEYKLSVKLMTKDVLDTHYKEHNEYIKVRPNMTYGELFRAVIKKCREIEGLSANDFRLIRRNELLINDKLYENFDDIVDLSKNDDKIMLDIEYLEFKYYIWESFDPRKKEDMLWKELNGICKDVEEEPVEEIPIENKSVEEEEQEQEENKEEKPVEQDNDKEPKEQKFTKKVKVNKLEEPKFNREGNGNEHEESKVKKDNINNNKEPVESKVKKKGNCNKLVELKVKSKVKVKVKVKVKEPVEQKFKKKVNGNEPVESKVINKGKVNKPEESKVNREGKGNEHEESKFKKKGNGKENVESKVTKRGGCCTCCKER